MDNKNVYEIGTIIFEDNINEQEVGGNNRFKPKRIGECKVEVYSNEGQIPHFHIYSLDHSFECCVRIYDANFFPHGGKYTDKLNGSQCKQLDQWLRKYNNNPFYTNWGFIEYIWNDSNKTCKYPENKKVHIQPNYSDMCNFKEVI